MREIHCNYADDETIRYTKPGVLGRQEKRQGRREGAFTAVLYVCADKLAAGSRLYMLKSDQLPRPRQLKTHELAHIWTLTSKNIQSPQRQVFPKWATTII